MGRKDNSFFIDEAVAAIKKGGIIAYPTESMYGLGCDPFNTEAITKLLILKKRDFSKGFILIASDWEQVAHLTLPIGPKLQAQVHSTWPGSVTWLFPVSKKVPEWIRGKHNTIALRITSHPIVRRLCERFEGAIVSTSANRQGDEPARTLTRLHKMFEKNIDVYVPGNIGMDKKATPIFDAMSGQCYR